MEKKLQIRQINDMHGNSYKIYDIMVKGRFGIWKSVHTCESLDDAIRCDADIRIEDLTINK